MFYVHPWEIDTDQPQLPVSWLTRQRHYRGIAKTWPRLERLLGEFRFTSVAEYYGLATEQMEAVTWPPAL